MDEGVIPAFLAAPSSWKTFTDTENIKAGLKSSNRIYPEIPIRMSPSQRLDSRWLGRVEAPERILFNHVSESKGLHLSDLVTSVESDLYQSFISFENAFIQRLTDGIRPGGVSSAELPDMPLSTYLYWRSFEPGAEDIKSSLIDSFIKKTTQPSEGIPLFDTTNPTVLDLFNRILYFNTATGPWIKTPLGEGNPELARELAGNAMFRIEYLNNLFKRVIELDDGKALTDTQIIEATNKDFYEGLVFKLGAGKNPNSLIQEMKKQSLFRSYMDDNLLKIGWTSLTDIIKSPNKPGFWWTLTYGGSSIWARIIFKQTAILIEHVNWEKVSKWLEWLRNH